MSIVAGRSVELILGFVSGLVIEWSRGFLAHWGRIVVYDISGELSAKNLADSYRIL